MQKSLQELGVESRFLGALAPGAEDETARRWRELTAGEKLLEKFTWRLGLNSIHALGTWSLLRDPWFVWADVVHLHNLHGVAFSYLALPALAARKPLVWTLHDMWPITGHCGFSLGCERWRTGCGRCPHLEVYPYAARDATRWEWRWKRAAVNRARPRLAAPSRWLCHLADEAFPTLAPAHHIPYSIDTGVFRPRSPADARSTLGLPADRVLLLSAASDLAEPRKGGHLLAEAMRKIPDAVLQYAALVTLGDGSGSWLDELRARGVAHIERETLDSALMSGRSVLELMGWEPHTARNQALRFRRHNLELLHEMAAHLGDEKALIAVAKQGRAQLEQLWSREREQRRARKAQRGKGFASPKEDGDD